MHSGFLDVLHADGPATDRTEKMALYGQFIGSWDRISSPTSRTGSSTGAMARFVSAGCWRAARSRKIVPGRYRGVRSGVRGYPVLPVAGNWYGTTLRVYDPGIDAWHILWTDPANQIYTQQIGRARGKDIVQEGKLPTGAILRWSFTEITANPFRWLGSIQRMTAFLVASGRGVCASRRGQLRGARPHRLYHHCHTRVCCSCAQAKIRTRRTPPSSSLCRSPTSSIVR